MFFFLHYVVPQTLNISPLLNFIQNHSSYGHNTLTLWVVHKLVTKPWLPLLTHREMLLCVWLVENKWGFWFRGKTIMVGFLGERLYDPPL